MYTEITVRESQREALQEIEGELGVPIRVIDGNYSTSYIAPEWIEAHLFDLNRDNVTGVSLDEAKEKGITVVGWACITNGSNKQIVLPPALWKRDMVAREYDGFAPGTDESAIVWKGNDHEVGPEVEGTAYCEVGDRTVAYYVYLAAFGTTRAGHLDKEKYLKMPILSSLNEDALKDHLKQQMEKNEHHFLEMCATRIENQKRTHRVEIENLETERVRNINALSRNLSQLRDKKLQIDIMSNMRDQSQDDWKAEWEALKRHDRIERISFANECIDPYDNNSNKVISILTKPIDITRPDTGETAPLGKMLIKIDMGSGYVKFFNTNNKRRNRDHPHILNNDPCWGDISEQVSKLIAEGQIGGLFELFLRYLGTANLEDDYGSYISWWFNEIPDEVEA